MKEKWQWNFSEDPRGVPERTSMWNGRWVWRVRRLDEGWWAVGVARDARRVFRSWRSWNCEKGRWIFELQGEYENRMDAWAVQKRLRRRHIRAGQGRLEILLKTGHAGLRGY